MDLLPPDWEYVEERAASFVGREWVFARVRSFLSGPPGTFLLRGDPGTGKTAIAARLAQASCGRSAVNTHITQSPVAEGTISAAVFCRAGRVTVLELVQRLSEQMVSSVEGFADVLQSTLAREINVGDVDVTTGNVGVGANVTGIRIVLSGLSEERAFSGGVAAPLRKLRELDSAPIVILVDAVDEAVGATEVNAFSRLLAKLDGIHLIVTCRSDARVLADFKAAEYQVNLVTDALPGDCDVRDYVRDRLGGRGLEGAIGVLVDRIATEAHGNFLYAFYVTGALIRANSVANLDEKAAHDLPLPTGGLPGVYEGFLDRQIAGDEMKWAAELRPVLAPLCVAFGDGFTTAQLRIIASRLASRDFSLSTARDITRAAGQFIDGPRPDGPFRAYHQSFVRFLTDHEQNPNWPIDVAETNNAVVEALSNAVRDGPFGAKDWAAADPYTRNFLAAHAAITGRLDDFLGDVGYLLAADPCRLLAVLSSASTATGRNVASVLRRAAHQLQTCPLQEAASYLELQARQSGLCDLADRVAQLGLARPWATPWAQWRGPQQRLRLAPDEDITAMTLADFSGERVAVLATRGGQLHIRRLTDDTNVRDPFTAHDSRSLAADARGTEITVLAAGEVNGQLVVLSGDGSGCIRVWNLLKEPAALMSRYNQGRSIKALALTEIGGTPAVVSADDSKARLWVLADGMSIDGSYEPLGGIRALNVTTYNQVPIIAYADYRNVVFRILPDLSDTIDGEVSWKPVKYDLFVSGSPTHRDEVTTLAIGDRAIAISGDHKGYVWIWNIRYAREEAEFVPIGRHQHPLPGEEGGSAISAVAIGVVNSLQIAASGDASGRIQVWDVAQARQIGDFPTAHASAVRRVAVTGLDGDCVIISHADDAVRVWDLNQPGSSDQPAITALTFADLDGTPVLFAGDNHGTVRVLRPADGHEVAPAFSNHRGEVVAVAVDRIANQPVVLSAGVDGTVQVWNPADATPLGDPYTDHGTGVTAVAVRQIHGKLVAASGGYDNMVRIWDVASRAPLGNPISVGGTVSLGGVGFAELGSRLTIVTAANSSPATIQALDLSNRSPTGHAVALDDRFGAVSTMQIGTQLLVAFSDYHGVVRLHNFTDGGHTDLHYYQQVSRDERPDLLRGLTATTFDGQPTVMAGSNNTGVINIWDVRSGRQQQVEVGSGIFALAVGPDRTLAVGTADGLVLIQLRDSASA